MDKAERLAPYFPNPDLPIGCWPGYGVVTPGLKPGYQEPGPLHEHDFTEIAIVENGHGMHEFDGTILPVRAGDVFVVNPGCSHAWVETDDLYVANVMITDFDAHPFFNDLRAHQAFTALFFLEPALRDQKKSRARLQLNSDQLLEVKSTVRRLDRFIPRLEAPYPSMALIHFFNLISILCEAYITAPRPAQLSILRMSKVIDYLESNYVLPPNHEGLAKMMHVSVATFYRLFREATGSSPANYVNRLRIDKACELLKTSGDTITEVAYQVGYLDSNYFSRIFKKIKGVSPKEYRRAGR